MSVIEIPFITVGPFAPHTHTVVFLHGRGDNAQKFCASLSYWRGSNGQTLCDAFPSFRWVFPQAPLRKCASLPDIIPQWFDVWDVRDFGVNEELQAFGLREVVPAIQKILADEARQLGSTLGGGDRWDCVVLAGISMGGATGVHTLLNLNIPAAAGGRLGAFMGFSCRCPFAGRPLSELRNILNLADAPSHDNVVRSTPVLLEHCADDPLVRIEWGRELRDTLVAFQADVSWKEYAHGAHWFHSPDGLDDVIEFLNRHVMGTAPNSAPTSLP
ncbi:hypothetical protein VTK73DRAFT_4457 [Phialemonium thermophilum]|uniref:Phospholipase/carboxylesterase/thioesterase domain-containing protein n=1 Tax=Phialemonium thermophilum TaxID=223376 RepID=A0ABR3WU19_9PEZI